jgi:hypothetical protein
VVKHVKVNSNRPTGKKLNISEIIIRWRHKKPLACPGDNYKA